MSLNNSTKPAAALFFNKYINSSCELLDHVNGEIDVNKYFLESNELIDDHRIFIFFNSCDQALDVFKDLISRFHNSSSFLGLENKIISNLVYL